MRMRKRHNLEPRMERCKDYLVTDPAARKGTWRQPGTGLWLEIGCGKGSFTCAVAEAKPDCSLVAIEKVPDAMILAMERASRAGLKNVCFLDYDAAGLREIFEPGELDGIYINFCDPWPKSRDAKFRLTAPAFLRIYADLLPVGGEIRFKTDNGPLFEWSVEQFLQEGWTLRELTRDLHAGGVTGILTDYERRFLGEGVPIKRLVAVRGENTLDHRAGEPPRLRNAALADARANQKEKQE
ncbi:MAG: tRNA (guanosine(46)-N7)-methyltransferase TrmB [Oscillospiraceae bacterium]|nr:tRNA (guanosine(46)-N7)-methyltransferase TrmB [Oscillospiraceae bacterium]